MQQVLPDVESITNNDQDECDEGAFTSHLTEGFQEGSLTKKSTRHHRSNSMNRMQQLSLGMEKETSIPLFDNPTELDSPSFAPIKPAGLMFDSEQQDMNKQV